MLPGLSLKKKKILSECLYLKALCAKTSKIPFIASNKVTHWLLVPFIPAKTRSLSRLIVRNIVCWRITFFLLHFGCSRIIFTKTVNWNFLMLSIGKITEIIVFNFTFIIFHNMQVHYKLRLGFGFSQSSVTYPKVSCSNKSTKSIKTGEWRW